MFLWISQHQIKLLQLYLVVFNILILAEIISAKIITQFISPDRIIIKMTCVEDYALVDANFEDYIYNDKFYEVFL